MRTTQRHNQRGFTLIEVLVVIAIIAILSTIVTISISKALQSSANSSRNSAVLAYITALDLYLDDHPNKGYPSNRASIPGRYICLGNDTCQGSVTGDDGLDEDLEPYIQPWVDTKPVPFNGVNFNGIAYKCTEPTSGNTCNEYSLQWYLVGENQDCVRGSQPRVNPPTGTTRCLYES